MGNGFKSEVHNQVDHAPVVHEEYEQHLAAAAGVLQEVVKLTQENQAPADLYHIIISV